MITSLMLAAGCGGGDPAISKAEYVREGNAICIRGNAEIAAKAKQPSPNADADIIRKFIEIFIPGIRDQLHQLRSLGYPKGDKAELEAIFNDAEALLARVERNPSLLDGHLFDEVNRRLTAYGLRICGS